MNIFEYNPGDMVSSSLIRDTEGREKVGFLLSWTMSADQGKYSCVTTIEFATEIVSIDAGLIKKVYLPAEVLAKIREEHYTHRNINKAHRRFNGEMVQHTDIPEEQVLGAMVELSDFNMQHGDVFRHKRNGTRIIIIHACVDVFGKLRDLMPSGYIFVYRNLQTQVIGARSMHDWLKREHLEWEKSELHKSERRAPF